MTRQMADRVSARIGDAYVGQVTGKIEAIIRRFRREDADSEGTVDQARAVHAALADVFDEIEFGEFETGLAEALFQAGAAGAAATPFASAAGDTE